MKYPNKWYARNKFGESAMQASIDSGNLEALKYLLEKLQENENVHISHIVDHDGNTLLSKAISQNQYEIVRYIIETYPCLLNVKNNHGMYPIHFSAIQGRYLVLGYIL